MKKYFLFAIFVVALAGCFDKKLQEKPQQSAIPVAVYKVKKQDIPLSFEYPTQLLSLQHIEIFPRVEGVLLEQNFAEGEVVQKGKKLFKIDPAKYLADVKMARAELALARASLKEASFNWDRSQKLFSQNALSPRERDQALLSFESAKANVENAKASLDNALLVLSYTDVIAPITGKTGIVNFDIGDLVGSAKSSGVLTTITQLDPIRAEFSIPSNDYYLIRTLKQDKIIVRYILQDGQIYKEEGKLDFLDSVIDLQTSTIKARAIVQNKDSLLIPGEFSRVRLEGLIAPNAIVIPQVALLQDANGSFVYKVVDGKAMVARVVLGSSIENSILIKEGLEEGDQVIVNQLLKVRPNMSVTLMQSNP